MPSLNAQCLSTVSMVADIILDDANWRIFGYDGRPRRGRIFQGFIAAPKIELETTLLRELWCASLGTICKWAFDSVEFQYREIFVAKLMEYAIDGLSEPLWPTLRFVTRRDAIEYLQRACSDYCAIDDSG